MVFGGGRRGSGGVRPCYSFFFPRCFLLVSFLDIFDRSSTCSLFSILDTPRTLLACVLALRCATQDKAWTSYGSGFLQHHMLCGLGDVHFHNLPLITARQHKSFSHLNKGEPWVEEDRLWRPGRGGGWKKMGEVEAGQDNRVGRKSVNSQLRCDSFPRVTELQHCRMRSNSESLAQLETRGVERVVCHVCSRKFGQVAEKWLA